MDKYEKKAEEAREKLVGCYKYQINSSCWRCEEFFSCKIRKDFVNKTYQSMSKDKSGGFEF